MLPCSLANRFLSGGIDIKGLPGYKKLIDNTTTCVDLVITEFKKILTKIFEKKSLDSFDVLVDEKSTLFQGAELLCSTGYFLDTDVKASKQVLLDVVSMRKSLVSVVTSSSERLSTFTDQERFEFAGQLLKSTWITGEFYKACKDNDWCDEANSTLQKVLPEIIGTGDLMTKLQAKVKDQVKSVADLFTKNIGDTSDKDKIVGRLARAFSRPGLEWMSLSNFMEL